MISEATFRSERRTSSSTWSALGNVRVVQPVLDDNSCVILAVAVLRRRELPVVRHHHAAVPELARLPTAERNAMDRALDKLEAFGERLPFPHQSAIRRASPIRELRPRAGRSPWRGLYARVGDVFVLLAVGPEADVDPLQFSRAVNAAQARLEELTSRGDP
jgi:hypothetical protein